MTMPEPTCQSCRYWRDIHDEDGEPLGECHRFPPHYDGWAMTRAEEWCGEHAKLIQCD